MPELSPERIATLNHRYNNFSDFNDDGSIICADPLTYREAAGDSMLHLAASANDCEAVSWLLSAGADPNTIGEMGQTALHWAAVNKNRGMADLLLSFGASTDIIDKFGQRPDMSALAD